MRESLQVAAWALVLFVLAIESSRSICAPPSQMCISLGIVFVAYTIKLAYNAAEWRDQARSSKEATYFAIFIVNYISSALLAVSVALPSLYKPPASPSGDVG